MSTLHAANGSCLCGGVRISTKMMSNKMGACHCDMCKKWAGGPLLAVDCGNDVTFEGKENVSVFNSSAWAERGFCKQCGSHLFYRLKDPVLYVVPVGLFDNKPPIVFDHQIFIEQKPAFYSFANETANLTGAEVFAKFAPQA